MIARALLRLSKPKASSWLASAQRLSFSTLPHNYAPPESKLQQFIKYIYQLEDKGSRDKAAELLATLQADSQIYADMLKAIEEQYQVYLKEEPDIVKTLKNKKALELSIKTAIEENKAIENRCHRDIENIKVYGVSRIAREIIEIADHLNHALSSLKHNSNNTQKELLALSQLHRQFYKMLQRYQIYEINPKDEPFDPNNHESLGLVDNEDQAKSHIVAETKRTGWKIRDRLLRHATVLIYK